MRQIRNNTEYITTKVKKYTVKGISRTPQKPKDSYEQAMDTSKYDQILNKLII